MATSQQLDREEDLQSIFNEADADCHDHAVDWRIRSLAAEASRADLERRLMASDSEGGRYLVRAERAEEEHDKVRRQVADLERRLEEAEATLTVASKVAAEGLESTNVALALIWKLRSALRNVTHVHCSESTCSHSRACWENRKLLDGEG